jgi:hypothetical protein
MTAEELDRSNALWSGVGSPLGSRRMTTPLPSGVPRPTIDLTNLTEELGQMVSDRESALARLLSLRGRARYTQRGWDLEQVVLIGEGWSHSIWSATNASTSRAWSSGRPHDAYWLLYREQPWEPFWTRDLTGFDPLDDQAREVLAFVALQIERDHHLGDRARVRPDFYAPPPRDAHLRHIREYLDRR